MPYFDEEELKSEESYVTDQSPINDDESDSISDSNESVDESDSSHESSDDEDDINWERIKDEAVRRHISKFEALVGHYDQEGDSHEIAEVKAKNDLLPIYRKEFRKVFFEYCKWMHDLRKNYNIRLLLR